MKTFKQYVQEGNPLSKVVQALGKTRPRGKTGYIATISHERGGMSPEEKKKASGKLQSAIARHVKKGMLKQVSGPNQSGEYRYAEPQPGEEGVAKEKSHVLAPGNHPKAHANFHRIMKELGKKAGQESVLKITKRGKDRPTGSLHRTDGSSENPTPVGKMYINAKMGVDSGRTKFKNKEASFVVSKKKPEGS